MSERQYRELPLKQLEPNPWNPRKRFTGPKFEEFTASIKSKGVLEPILVRPLPVMEVSLSLPEKSRSMRQRSAKPLSKKARRRVEQRKSFRSNGGENDYHMLEM